MKRKYTQEISSCRECHGLKLKGAIYQQQYSCEFNPNKKTKTFISHISTPETLQKALKELEEMFSTCEKWEEIK